MSWRQAISPISLLFFKSIKNSIVWDWMASCTCTGVTENVNLGWKMTRGHFSTLKIGTKTVNFIPGVIFQRYEIFFLNSDDLYTLEIDPVENCPNIRVLIWTGTIMPIFEGFSFKNVHSVRYMHMRTWLFYFRLICPITIIRLILRLKSLYTFIIKILCK